jgi:DNA modification methylase
LDEYKVIAIDKLQPFLIRGIRPDVVTKLKERIGVGFNPARPLTVVKQDGHFIVADGNHRLQALNELGIKEAPVIIREGDPYWLAIQGNTDEDTYAPMDLFDWLDVIKSLKSQSLTQEKIGERIGWTQEQVSRHQTINEVIMPDILKMALEHQKGRGIDEYAQGHNFTERWFRDSGLYDLNSEYQSRFMDWFIKDKKCSQTNAQIVKLTKRFKWHQHLKELAAANFAQEVTPKQRDDLLKAIDDSAFGDEPGDDKSLLKSIAAINEKVLGIKLFAEDALTRIPKLKEQISLVIADPPYNTTDNEWDKFPSPEAYLEWMARWLHSLKPKLADKYHLFVFCAPEYMGRIEHVLQDEGYPIISRIIWAYRNLVMGRDVNDRFISTWQPVFHCGNHPLNWSTDWNEERFDVQMHATPQSNFKDKKLHPTSKPVKLIELFIKVGSKPGDYILDPFAGGGVTGIACQTETQRRCILIEKEEEYVTIIEQNLKIKRVED